MPNYVKLKNAGDAIVVHVESAKVNTSGKWPTIDFMGKDAKTHQPVVVAVPQKSAERQMERIGLTVDACPGLTLGISRAASDDSAKPYWNLAVVGEHEVKPAPRREPASEFIPGHPVSGSPPEPPPLDDEDAPPDAIVVPKATVVERGFSYEWAGDPLYLAITQWVLGTVAPLYNQFEVGPTPEALAAMVATVYIQHNRNR